MKKRVILTTAVSFLLLLAVIAAGINAVFTVTLVQSEFSSYSAEGRAEAAQIKEKLDGFVGSSTTFLDLDDLRAEIEAYPCMRIELLEKSYPSTVKVHVSERKEGFAYPLENGKYAVFDEEGTYLYDRDSNISRAGGENILLEGVALELHNVGEPATGEEFGYCLEAYGVLAEIFGEARANVISVRTDHSSTRTLLFVQMREGIKLEIVDPEVRAADKVRAALCDERYGYLARSDGEKTAGTVTAVGSSEGAISVDYNKSRG